MTHNPFDHFRNWFDEASRSGIPQHNAMSLATLDANQQPTTRMVLLSSYDENGFVFHTNYNSHKAHQMRTNPKAALLFWWEALARQIRIEGEIEQTSAAESDTYFSKRPRGSQIGAWASEQSEILQSREQLEQRVYQLEIQYRNKIVPRPPYWGGYRLRPIRFEFWAGRESRLHDRMFFEKTRTGEWNQHLLYP